MGIVRAYARPCPNRAVFRACSDSCPSSHHNTSVRIDVLLLVMLCGTTESGTRGLFSAAMRAAADQRAAAA
eukprot:1732047-Prymnesium_polylepis.1